MVKATQILHGGIRLRSRSKGQTGGCLNKLWVRIFGNHESTRYHPLD